MISVGCHLKPDSSRSPWNDMFNMNYLLSSSNFLTASLYRSVRYRKCHISTFMQPVWKLNILPPQGTDFPPSWRPGSRAGLSLLVAETQPWSQPLEDTCCLCLTAQVAPLHQCSWLTPFSCKEKAEKR